jgi:hypothetical protein
MNPDRVRGFETGMWLKQISANNYNGSLERLIREFTRNLTILKISGCNSDIRRNPKKNQLIRKIDHSF